MKALKIENQSIKTLVEIFIVALAYFITGKLGTLLAVPPGYATPIWAPSGIALAAVLLFGNRVWPGIFLGSCLVNLGTTFSAVSGALVFKPLILTAVVGLGASAQAVLGAYLICRFIGFPNPLDREKDILLFLLLGGPASCILNATVSVTTLSIAGVIPFANYGFNWGTWWIGDSIGVMLLAPMLVMIFMGRRKFVLIPFGVTFFLVILAFVYANMYEKARIHNNFLRRSETLAKAVQIKTENDLNLLYTLRTFLYNASMSDNKKFRDYTRQLFASSYPEIEGFFWQPNTGGLITAFKVTDRHRFFTLISNRSTHEAKKSALREGKLVIAETPRKNAVIAFLPFYDRFLHSVETEEQKNRKAFIAMIVNPGLIIQSAIEPLDRDGIDIQLLDRDNGALIASNLWQEPNANPRAGENLQKPGELWQTSFALGGRSHYLRFSEGQAYLIAHHSWLAWTVLLVGFLFTILFGAFLMLITGHTSKVESLVADRTASLRTSEAKLRSVLQSAEEAIFISDEDGKIISWNPAAEKSFGYSGFEIIGKPVSTIIPSSVLNASKLPAEIDGIRKDGSRIPIELYLSSWLVDKKKYTSGFIRDITERKKVDQMKNDVIGFASHQLKTPLAQIKNLTENMLSGLSGKLADKQETYVRLLRDVSTRNLRLITDLFDVSKINTGALVTDIQAVALRKIVDSMLADYAWVAEKKKLSLSVNEESPNVTVYADFQKTAEALRNVFENAARLTEEGSITLTISRDSRWGIVEIKDTGPGMPKSVESKIFSQELIFSAFPAGEEGRTGLGLYIAKNFMQLQGGDISVRSKLGEGSVFTFRLPLAV